MKEDMEFRNRLIELRKQRGWSQEELGYKLDVSRQTISKWENGESTPELSKLMKMCKLYDISMDELVSGKKESEVIEVKAEPVIENNSEVPKVEINYDENYKNKELGMIALQKVIVRNKKIIIKNLTRIISAIFVILLGAYLILCAYRFSILNQINNKFNEYKNIDNCYYERNEVVTDCNGTAYITNSRYWYKDGILKIETIKTQNGNAEIVYKIIDLNKKESYVLFEKSRKGIKQINENELKEFEDGIIMYVVGENYFNSIIDTIKSTLNIFKYNIKREADKYVLELNSEIDNEKVYDKDTGLIKQNYSLSDFGEEIKILHKLEFGIVKDEDVNDIDLSTYQITEIK